MELLEARVLAALERQGYAGTGSLLVVAVSGGPDSVALLHALLSLSVTTNLRLHVAHLNHNFRGEEAEEDARFVANLAQEQGLPATVEKADPVAYQRDTGISSFEEAARELRYGFLSHVAAEDKPAAVALGHNADDQAETVIMHIIRGSGLHGLKGMEELSTWRSRDHASQVALFRPLLQVSKAETADYCRRRGIPFREDTGNLLSRFTRNRVRHQLLPELRSYNPRIGDALVRLANLASLEVDYLDTEVSRLWPSVAGLEQDWLTLDSNLLASLHPLIVRLVLRRAYEHVAGDTRRLQEIHLGDMARFLTLPAGRVLDLPSGLRLHSGYGRLLLGRGPDIPCPLPALEEEHLMTLPPPGAEVTIHIPGWEVTAAQRATSTGPTTKDPFIARLDPEAVGAGPLIIRTRRPGDRFQPSGMQSSKKLQDFFVDQKVPRSWRDRVPLIIAERGIAWVVGHRVAEWARARPDSEVLQVRFSPE